MQHNEHLLDTPSVTSSELDERIKEGKHSKDQSAAVERCSHV